MDHFISLADLTPDDLKQLLTLAQELKEEWRESGNRPRLRGKNLALVFMKPSLRTRVSFEMAMVHLGGYAFYLAPGEIKLGSRESVPDVARVLSSYVDGIMARVFEHEHIVQLAEFSSVPLINGLSDYNHPVQAFTDLFTILEAKGHLNGLKITYVGDGNNVARSLLFGAMKMGMHFAIATPEGYNLSEEDVARAREMRVNDEQTIMLLDDPRAAVTGADVIYTDVWTSMGQEEERAQRMRLFPPYQVNQQLVEHADPGCIVLHCLPAHRGEEITDAVADGPHSVIFQQAENRMHAQKAILQRLMGE